LRKSFEEQMNTLQERLRQYQLNNFDNRSSALINQIYSQIEDLEERSSERLDEIERERSIQLQPIKRIAQLVKEYEYRNGC
jgi:secreted Zn-dependent insulinase-like peptidase